MPNSFFIRRYCPLLAIACLALASPACNRRDKPRPATAPDIFVIVMDAMSAPYLTPYGDPNGTSPSLDRFAHEAVVFENAYGQSSSTVPSTASLMTGTLPTTHRLSESGTLSNRFKTMPQVLTESGFVCRGFIGNPHAGAHALGLDRGYESCVQVYALESLQAIRPLEELTAFRVALPEDMNDQIFPVLASLPQQGQFTYIHYLQPHGPYEPPQRFLDEFDPDKLGLCHCGGIDWKTLFKNSRMANVAGQATQATIDHMKARYRANIRYVDDAFGRLVDELKKRGLYDSSMIVVMSDHGEAFFLHRLFGHKVGLYDDMVRIPLMIKMPKTDAIRPARAKSLAATVDVLPTILDYLGIALPSQLEGHSLLGLIAGRGQPDTSPEVVMSLFNLQQHALRHGEFKLLYKGANDLELYNVVKDPDERQSLTDRQPAAAAALVKRLEQRIDLMTNTTREPGSMDLRADPRMDAHLDALGYVGAAKGQARSTTTTSAPAVDKGR